jgi:hypothetical protein
VRWGRRERKTEGRVPEVGRRFLVAALEEAMGGVHRQELGVPQQEPHEDLLVISDQLHLRADGAQEGLHLEGGGRKSLCGG